MFVYGEKKLSKSHLEKKNVALFYLYTFLLIYFDETLSLLSKMFLTLKLAKHAIILITSTY